MEDLVLFSYGFLGTTGTVALVVPQLKQGWPRIAAALLIIVVSAALRAALTLPAPLEQGSFAASMAVAAAAGFMPRKGKDKS